MKKDLEMEVYKSRKITENQGIEIQLILHQLDEAREELKKSLKRRKYDTKRLTLPGYMPMVDPMNLNHQL